MSFNWIRKLLSKNGTQRFILFSLLVLMTSFGLLTSQQVKPLFPVVSIDYIPDGSIPPSKLAPGIPRAVDGSTITIDQQGVISSIGGGGGGYEPDNITIGLNTSSQLEVMDSGISDIKIADVNGSKIADMSIPAGKLGTQVVNGVNINDNVIATQHLIDGVVTEIKRAPIRDVDELSSATPVRIGEIIRYTGLTPYRYYIGHETTNGAWVEISNYTLTVDFSDLTGQLDVAQIPDNEIVNAKINDVAASKITGQITDSQLADGIPKSVDGTTITIDANGIISAVSGGGYEPDNVTIGLNDSDLLEALDGGWVENDGSPNGAIGSDRVGQICRNTADGTLWMSQVAGSNTAWLQISNSSFSADDVENLIYKEGAGNPNVNGVPIDRMGQVYCNTNNNATFIAINSSNPTWKKVTN